MRKSTRIVRLAAVVLPALLISAQSGAQSPPSAEALAAQIEALKRDYEGRLEALESQLSTLKARSESAEAKPASPTAPAKRAPDSAFNPAIGIVFDGKYASFTADESAIPGYPSGHESERAPEGLSLGHTEVTASGNIDDKFRGALTLGLGAHPGEATEVELEEAYVQTLPGAGLLDGMRVKAGRALWTFGYLNEQHAHGDDFADRPLPYRAFLDNAFNDDGVEVSLVLPAAVYAEFGGGLFRGDDRPFGGSDNGLRARSLYARVGWDMGRDAAVRVGAYLLDGKSRNRGGGHGHGHEDEDEHAHEDEHDHEDEHAHDEHEDEHEDEHAHDEHEDEHEDEHAHDEHEDEHEHAHHDHAEFFTDGMFTGTSRLYGIDVRFTLAPTGNARESEVIVQGEYFWRREDGTYSLEEESEDFDSIAHGWYVQGVYKPAPSWRIGARYARLSPPGGSDLDHDSQAFGAMVDWTNSEFGRIRVQYNHEDLNGREKDNQILVQYVMSLGAHAAHSF